MQSEFKTLLSPFTIRGKTYRNRILTSPVNQPFYLENGGLSQEARLHLLEQARGGAAQVTIGEQPVDPSMGEGKTYDVLGERIPEPVERNLASYVMEVHNLGALASIELGHPGIICAPSEKSLPDGTVVPAMDDKDMDAVCEMYAHAARRFLSLGFDGFVIHSGHGTLLAQFISARSNRRTDAFGGSLENRIRFPVRVVKAVREAVGPNCILELRISGTEGVEGGITPEDNIVYCSALEGVIDIVHVSAGLYDDPRLFARVHPSIYIPNGCNADIAGFIRANIKTPVAVVGGINTPELAEEILASGKADLICMGREHIAEPRFARKLTEGRSGEVTPCVRCLNCMDISQPGKLLLCTVNPRAGRLSSHPVEYPKADTPRKVVVIGGGPAGMKAAITAKRCGHEVVLFEKTDSLGGRIRFTDRDAVKCDLRRFKDHLIRNTLASGVTVRLNTEATQELVAAEEPYAVIAAVGSEPLVLPIPGLDSIRHALAVYDEPESVGKRVILVGGGMVGCEIGIHLAQTGHEVTIVEMADEVAQDCAMPARDSVLLALLDNHIDCRTGERCVRVSKQEVVAVGRDGEELHLQADEVLYALGMRSVSPEPFRGLSPWFAAAGDCLKVGKVLGAVHQGYFCAKDIG